MLRVPLKEALKEATKAQNKCAMGTLRLILAALKDRDIAARDKGNFDGIADEEVLEMLQKMVKQRRESIEIYEKAGRTELAERESQEIEIIKHFLPSQLGEEDVRGAVGDVIGEMDATSLKDMGRVMGALKERFAGRMDFGMASTVVKEQLG